jgi:hypothetical protein
MKKLLFVLAFIASLFTTSVFAQSESPEAMQQRMKDRIKPALIEKTGLSEVQADKVIDINFNLQRQRRQVRMDQATNDEEKAKRNTEIDAARDKEYSAIPLTEEQIKSVNLFFEEMRKQQKKSQG